MLKENEKGESKPRFVWTDYDEFIESGGKLVQAILFRAMNDSLTSNEKLRDESRQWLEENFESIWEYIYGGDHGTKIMNVMRDMWDHGMHGDMTPAQMRYALTRAMMEINIVDPEGESRYDPLKYRRDDGRETMEEN